MGDDRAMRYVVTAAVTAVEPARDRPPGGVPGRPGPVNAGRPAPPDRANRSWPPVACRGMGDWPFFGADTEGASARARRVGLAKAICASCAAVHLCRSFAVRTGQVFGVWGGLSEQELRFLNQQSAPTDDRGNACANGS
jgi:WhiB family redox-sensing transcriptional regulator